MRTNKDAVHSVPGKSPVEKRQKLLEVTKKELENSLIKDCNSPDSNSENVSPSIRRKRKDLTSVAQVTPTKRKIRIPEASDRKLRGKRNAEHDSNATDSFSNLDLSGVNESLEQSKLNEESLVSINSVESKANDSARHSDTMQETLNSISDGDENIKSNRKLRSSRRLLPSTVDVTENGKSGISNDKVAMENSEVLLKSADVSNDDAITLNKESTPTVQSSTNEVSIKNEDDDDSIKLKLEKHSTDTVVLEEDKMVTQAESTSYNDEVDNFNIREEKVVVIDIDNPIPVAIVNIKSPSSASVDSAKGSSIANDSDSTNFATGDLYWGRIHNFTYWACMICPDDSEDDNLITRLIDQQMEVHVRFFADNARHSWVKRENLIPYHGLENYREHLRELKEKFGEKSIKYQSFLPKRSKLKTWLDAVKEADVVATIPYPERMKKFFQLNEEARERNKEERMRRKSLSLSQSTKNLIDNSNTELSNQSQDTAKKRNRSESPPSPAFSPIRKIKRRKTTADATELMKSVAERTPTSKLSENELETEYNTLRDSRNNHNKNDIFETPQFREFYNIMKDFVLRGVQSEFVEMKLFGNIKKIWTLQQILHKPMANNQFSAQIEEKHKKRLSLRLKDLKQRQRTEAVSGPTVSTTQNDYFEERRRLSDISKVKRATRPMEEVIDDIFNLDNRYLFDNMGRDPVCKYCYQPGGELRRCSKGCLSWLHNECMQVENIPSPFHTPIKQKMISNVKKRSIKTENLVAPSMPSPSVRSILHVTADTDENDNENLSLTKVEVDSMTEEKALDAVPMPTKEIIKGTIVCRECANNEQPKCFVCHTRNKQQILPNGEAVEENVIACNMMHCAKVYHPSCLKYWPQAKITKSKNSIALMRCPSHVCHTCVSDDPKGKYQHLYNSNTIKCVKCPATYHMDSTCIPAGSKILTAAHIICPRHAMTKSDQNVNVSWCFICVRGGQLICCETCPTAVHAECSNVALDPNESYICDECESGRMPLYGEMVWAKFTTYRWWPAIILPPTEVPLNIRNKVHNPFEFVIRFFGTHDHGWISRRRVYLYLEGDWSELPQTKRSIDQSYLRGVIEAKAAYEIIKAKTLIRIGENENKEKLHPQPYIKIRANRAVPPVKLHPNLEKVGTCECDPEEENPCGADSNCLNRVLYHECNPKFCPAGERCQNQMFEARVSPALEIIYAKKERGFGLKCGEAIKAGAFIIEYVGEVINSKEFDRRMQQKSIDRDENYYFLYVEKDYIIDAGPKGNMARFMNHSCDPNCETQKWSVNGLNRVGLFAIKDIPANTELTFNYHWDELLGNDQRICHCGSENCTGQIGKLPKDLKLKPASADEQSTSADVKTSKTEQSKVQKKHKQRKNSNLKISHQKDSKNDGQVSKKPKIVRRKKLAANAITKPSGSKGTG